MFCQNCGKEILDNASVCLGCGCWVDNKSIKQRMSKEEETIGASKKDNVALWVKIFLIVSFSLACVSIGCFILSVAYADLYVRESGYGTIYSYFYLNKSWILVSFIVSTCALGMAIVEFVFGLKADRGFKYLSIANYIVSIVGFLAIFFAYACL